MRTKTIFIIIFTVLITIFLMINTDVVEFNFIFVKREISKLLVVGICTFIGFILGYWVGRPKVTVSSYDKKENPQVKPEDHKKIISDEDRDYIS